LLIRYAGSVKEDDFNSYNNSVEMMNAEKGIRYSIHNKLGGEALRILMDNIE